MSIQVKSGTFATGPRMLAVLDVSAMEAAAYYTGIVFRMTISGTLSRTDSGITTTAVYAYDQEKTLTRTPLAAGATEWDESTSLYLSPVYPSSFTDPAAGECRMADARAILADTGTWPDPRKRLAYIVPPVFAFDSATVCSVTVGSDPAFDLDAALQAYAPQFTSDSTNPRKWANKWSGSYPVPIPEVDGDVWSLVSGGHEATLDLSGWSDADWLDISGERSSGHTEPTPWNWDSGSLDIAFYWNITK